MINAELEFTLRNANLQAKTGTGYERKVAKFLESKRYHVLRTDFGNKMPDFCVIDHSGKAIMVECKNYQTAKTEKAAISRKDREEGKKINSCKKRQRLEHKVIYLIAYNGDSTTID